MTAENHVSSGKQNWDKQEYLYRMFSNRTRGKEKENYIVNAIWARLDDLRIKPVTQQYVRCKEGYYLIDLYFPQINFGVECDEEYHKKNRERDIIRELDLGYALASCSDEGLGLERVDATLDAESLHRRIEEIVLKMKSRIDEQGSDFKPWTSPDDDWAEIRSRGALSIADGFSFRTIADICKRCFGKKDDYAIQRSFFRVDDSYMLWCPKLAVEVDGRLTAQSRGWVNELSYDWETITEYNDSDRKEVAYADVPRLTFAKSKDERGEDAYRFVGVFKYDRDEGGHHIYKKVDDSFELIH